MQRGTFSAPVAIIAGTLIAGILDIVAVFAFWITRDVSPAAVLQAIASSVLGADAFTLGATATGIGLLLHFLVSLVFAAAYVIVSARFGLLRRFPIPFGLAYGALSYAIMTFGVVPLSYAQFGQDWPPPLVNLVVSLFIHLFLFGLPIALCASRIARAGSKGIASQVPG